MTFTIDTSATPPLPFEAMPSTDFETTDHSNDELPEGYVSARAGIPKELNDRLKAMARRQGKTAQILIGEIVKQISAELDWFEIQDEAARLKERYGKQWLLLLQKTKEAQEAEADTSSPL